MLRFVGEAGFEKPWLFIYDNVDDSRVTQADVDLADRLLAALDARPDIGDMTFQQVLTVLSL